RRRHTRFSRDWSSDVCSSDLGPVCDSRIQLNVLDTLDLVQIGNSRRPRQKARPDVQDQVVVGRRNLLPQPTDHVVQEIGIVVRCQCLRDREETAVLLHSVLNHTELRLVRLLQLLMLINGCERGRVRIHLEYTGAGERGHRLDANVLVQVGLLANELVDPGLHVDRHDNARISERVLPAALMQLAEEPLDIRADNILLINRQPAVSKRLRKDPLVLGDELLLFPPLADRAGRRELALFPGFKLFKGLDPLVNVFELLTSSPDFLQRSVRYGFPGPFLSFSTTGQKFTHCLRHLHHSFYEMKKSRYSSSSKRARASRSRSN